MKNVLLATALFSTILASLAHGQSAPAATASTAATAASDAPAAPAAGACPTLQFTGLKTGPGLVMIAVYGSAETYLKKPLWVKALPVEQGTMDVPMCDVAAAEVAVTAFQDLNGNGKLDSNPIGIPSEPYGASGTPALFSAPTWSDTKVSISGCCSPIIIKF